MITVFTPTYNRANLIYRLYQSLCKQTYKNFEWVVVDDGSSDNTEEILRNIINQNKINVRYYKQENQGKHIAINKGVEKAKGDLFFIVDSDDFLTNDSLEIINNKYLEVKDISEIGAVAGRRGYICGGCIGTKEIYDDVVMTSLDFRFKKKIKGDMAEVFKIEVLKQFPFPKFEGEVFCPEALVWQMIDAKYKTLWFSRIVYRCEYLKGGLTDNSFIIRKRSPKASCLYYSNLSKYKIPFFQKIKAVANYWRFAIYDNEKIINKLKKVSFWKTLIAFPIFLLLVIKDKK